MKKVLLLAITLLVAGCGGPAAVRPNPAAGPAPIAAADARNDVVLYAMGLIGVGYRFGGDNPSSGLDCSGMVDYVFRNSVGVDLPHSASRMAQMGREVAIDDLQPGDLVFFNTTGRRYSHVGIYIGDGRFVHAPSTNGRIKTSSIRSGYYAERLVAARTLFR
jgi:cell wall-associated NlpC family hydrolase